MSTTRLYDARTRIDALTDVLGSVGAIAEELSRGIAEVESERDALTREVQALRQLDNEAQERVAGLRIDLDASREAQARAERGMVVHLEIAARAERERDEARKMLVAANDDYVEQRRCRLATEAQLHMAQVRAEAAEQQAGEARARCAVLVEWITRVVSRFRGSEALGYRSRDRQYAIEMLEAALASASPAKPNVKMTSTSLHSPRIAIYDPEMDPVGAFHADAFIERKALEASPHPQEAPKRTHVHCSACGTRCSGVDPVLGLVVRAWVMCPECLASPATQAEPKP